MNLYKFIGFGSEYGWSNTVDILVSKKIWLSSTLALNDPFEGRVMRRDAGKVVETENYRVLSLTANLNNNLMWSHYAHSHNGIVIQFDIKKCKFLSNVKKVNYVNRLPSGKLSATEVLTFKQKGWEYEDEYRILEKKRISDLSFYGDHYSFDEAAIKKVYIGKNVDGVKSHTVYKMCSNINIPCFIYDNVKSNFQITFKKISNENVFKRIYRQDVLLEMALGKRKFDIK